MDLEDAGEDLERILAESHSLGRITLSNAESFLYDTASRAGAGAERDFLRDIMSGDAAIHGLRAVPGMAERCFVASAPVAARGEAAAAVAVYQPYSLFRKIYDPLMEGLSEYFAPGSRVCLVSAGGQLLSSMEYNSMRGRLEETVAGDEAVSANALGSGLLSAFREALGAGSAVTASADGEDVIVVAAEIAVSPFALYIAVPGSYAYQTAGKILGAGIVIFIALIFVMHAILHFTAFRISKSINAVSAEIQDIASGRGVLSRKLDVRGSDELIGLAENFNRFVDSLNAMIRDVQKSASSMTSMADRLEGDAGGIAESVSAIAANIGYLRDAVEEQESSVTVVSSTITRIAGNIESLTGQIESQSSSVTESSAAVQQMVSNMGSISASLSKAAERFGALKENAVTGKSSIDNVRELASKFSAQSASLLEANSIIKSIAGQTSLLAMNAAIESAHAGDSGKGFAVVAEEIRTLSENASKQSKSIASVLKETVQAIGNIESAAGVADGAFDSVAEMIDSATALVTEINFSMREQSSGSQQVLESLASIESATMQIRDGAVEMNSGTASILSEMGRLSGASQNVHEGTGSIAHSADAIAAAATKIGESSASNKEAIKDLARLASRFKI